MCNTKHYFRFPNSICSGSTAYNGTCYSRWALHKKMLTLARIDLDNLWNNWRFCTSISSFKIKLEEIYNNYIDSWINLIFYWFFQHSTECQARGGNYSGSCANGFGVCCICKSIFIFLLNRKWCHSQSINIVLSMNDSLNVIIVYGYWYL